MYNTYTKSRVGPSALLCKSLVPKILDKLNSVPSLAVASPTTRTAFKTARTGPTWMLRWAAANKWRSQLKRTPKGGRGAVNGGEPTEYKPGCGPSAVRNRRNNKWHVKRIPPSATPPPLSKDFTYNQEFEMGTLKECS